MRAMVLRQPASIETAPLALEEWPDPEPGPGEIAVEIAVCGVCRTDLHVIEGELPPRREAVIPGHQIVGRVSGAGPGARRFSPGERVGIAWLHRSCGRCSYCLAGSENLCRAPLFSGWHVHGGYAERVVVPEDFAYAMPAAFSDQEAAPLLCAGIIGFRALRRSRVGPGQRLGLYGFGSSAHIALQVALHQGCEVFVASRNADHRELARQLGAVWAGGPGEPMPEPLDGAVLFAPAGSLVPVALRALAPGGTLACAGIYMTDIPELEYETELFEEKTLTSVTANTRGDGEDLLRVAAEIPIRPHTSSRPLEEANQVLQDLKRDQIQGSAVLQIG
jgi:propanol-preferring alcohol dehydrogenase